jgi:predicted methyltransferase
MSIKCHNTAARKPATLLIGIWLAYVLAGCAGPGANHGSDNSRLYELAKSSPVRSDADRLADARRRPIEFLEFAGVKPGMRVLDVAAGGGYTTQLLALVVGNRGTVWAQGAKPQPNLEKRLNDHPQANIIRAVRPFDDPVPDEAAQLDLITLILNYHDIAYLPVDRAKMNQRLFEALKPGGHFVIVDHSARPGSGTADSKTLHRIDEALVLAEVRQAGFQLEKAGDFLRNPADSREKPSSEKGLMSDRFALRLVKPSIRP